jgi:hypothetical protein
MKLTNFLIIASILLVGTSGIAQTAHNNERYGNTLNLGVGLGYYSYVGSTTPVLHADYEFPVVRSFTLAPFINYFSYSNYYYWGNPSNPYRDYSYRETVIPLGVKGTYYFDKLLGLNKKWDIYAAGSVGFVYRKTTWENGYYGQTTIRRGTGALYLDLHLGAEYHVSRKAGIFLDLSTGVSTLGLAIHF